MKKTTVLLCIPGLMLVVATPLCVNTTSDQKPRYYHDCTDAKRSGQRSSGVYSIKPDNFPPLNVYCDMETEDGEWTVIHRRMDGSVDFNRKWRDYSLGFGDLQGEFWLGLSKIHRLTEAAAKKGKNVTLRVDFQEFGEENETASYHSFYVSGLTTGYQISFDSISGNYSEGFSYSQNNMTFSTDDVDNDLHPSQSCAIRNEAGWWYNECVTSRLTAPYLTGDKVLSKNNDILMDFSYYFSEMKLREQNYEAAYRDCKEAFDVGQRTSGIFTISPDDQKQFKVYCDMERDGGGWTVFQRRQDGSEDFYRDWADYEAGFGDLNGEFWLGLDKIHRLTTAGQIYTLRIDLRDHEGNNRYAKYSTFSVSDSSTNYRLALGTYSGDATDSFSRHNGMMFSTKDRDNDIYSGGNCVDDYKGGWWYDACHEANLNGLYSSTTYGEGINWRHWRGYYYTMKFTEMKVRRN